MGNPSIENFDITFIRRTAKNLKNYKGKFEFTMLLNSLFGLIIFPNEIKRERDFPFEFLTKKLKDFEEFNQIFSKQNEIVFNGKSEIPQKKFYWLSDKNNECVMDNVEVGSFFTRMRHGIAHSRITPVSKPENKKIWSGVILINKRTKDQTKNFEVCLMEDEIRILANFISSEYRKVVILNKRGGK